MDLLTSPSSTLHSSQQQQQQHTMSSSSSSSADLNSNNTFARKLENFARVIITCIFAAVGSVVGAVTGGLIGLATESGLLRGAGIGAISGAVFTIEAVDSSLAIWHTSNSGIWSILYLIDIACSLFNGRLVREKVGPAMRSAVESQMSEMDSPLIDMIDIFDTGGKTGMARDSVDKLPIISITSSNNVDDVGDRVSCAVCLQEFEIGEAVRCLPHCHHMYHMPCIDGWLIKNGSCPLCRREF